MSAQTPQYTARKLPLVAGRVPLLPVESVLAVFAAEEPLEALRELLRENVLARQALYAASPSLFDALEAWLAGEPAGASLAPLRALAYVARMAARATPFGVVAGIGSVAVGERATLRVDEAARRTRTRPDMSVLADIVAAVEAGPARRRVSFATNRAAIERGDRLYVTNLAHTAYEPTEDSFSTHQIPVSLKHTAAVRFIREFALAAQPYERIAAALAERFDATLEQSEYVVERMIEAGVLISELRASPIGDPIGYLAERLAVIEPSAGGRLREALDAASRLDALPLTERTPQAYRGAVESFRALCSDPPATCVQIDLHSPFSGTLPERVLRDVERLAQYWVRFARAAKLERFRERFLERYDGAERMVALLELVDPTIGLGLSDPLDYEAGSTAKSDALLMHVACEAARSCAEEIELGESELELLAAPAGGDLPPSVEIGFHVAAASREALERGEYRVLPSSVLATDRATRSLGRFAELFEDAVQERVRDVALAGLDPGVTSAELAFAPPDARMYNVTIRPHQIGTVIPLGVAGPRFEDELSPDDLWVGLDDNRFFLWSQSRACRVVPRESHLFTTDRGAPNVCRFLAAIASDGRRLLRGFDWGAAAGMTYLPRVRAGNLILSERRWRFPRAELGGSPEEAARALARWRELWHMPRYVRMTEYDNYLILDLDSAVCAHLVFDQAGRERVSVTFSEVLPSPGDLWVEGAAGRYAVEFVAAMLPAKAEPVPARGASAPECVAQRTRYGFGSQWLYAKLYLGEQAADDFLLRAVAPVLGELRAAGWVDRWFFVRYADPQPHLRLRFHAPEAGDRVRERFIAAAEGWLREERVARYAFDTYDPEYERYGGVQGVAAAERLFTACSDRCLELLARTPDTSDARVAAAAESFALWIGEPLLETAIQALRGAAQRKLPGADRGELRRIAALDPQPQPLLEEALQGASPERRLAAFFHMHCNRLGVRGDAERRAVALLRAVLVGRRARLVPAPQRELQEV